MRTKSPPYFAYAENISSADDHINWFINGSLIDSAEKITSRLEYGTEYILNMIAYSNEQCTDTITEEIGTIQLNDYISLNLPNIITPNGDFINDFFEPDGLTQLYDCGSLKIYNRWGELIFDSNGHSLSWDGRSFDGELVKTGEYFYIMELSSLIYKGHITVLK